MPNASIKITLPTWCSAFIQRKGDLFDTVESRMRFALAIAEKNIQYDGGPFGAAVFDADHRLLSIGMNLVTPTNCSMLHAEVVALMLAEESLHSYDLSLHGKQQLELVTTCEPCTMCLGAMIWSGVSSMVSGARDEDARAIGFDEGPKPAHITTELEHRGIHAQRDILRDEAISLLQRYQHNGQPIYNPG